jgi:hypothetical protein
MRLNRRCGVFLTDRPLLPYLFLCSTQTHAGKQRPLHHGYSEVRDRAPEHHQQAGPALFSPCGNRGHEHVVGHCRAANRPSGARANETTRRPGKRNDGQHIHAVRLPVGGNQGRAPHLIGRPFGRIIGPDRKVGRGARSGSQRHKQTFFRATPEEFLAVVVAEGVEGARAPPTAGGEHGRNFEIRRPENIGHQTTKRRGKSDSSSHFRNAPKWCAKGQKSNPLD